MAPPAGGASGIVGYGYFCYILASLFCLSRLLLYFDNY